MGVRVVDGGEVQCVYSHAFVSELTVPELYAVIQHEVEHVVRCHCTRSGEQHPVAWNIAADMAVNGQERESRIGYKADNGATVVPYRDSIVWVPQHWPSNENAEYYYRRLPKGQELIGFGTVLDDHSLWEESDVSQGELVEIALGIVEHAKAKGRGQIPWHLKLAIEQLGQHQLPWHVLLRRLLSAYLGQRRTTYSRRNRRKDIFGVPGHVRRAQPHVSVIVDVSGSIRRDELSQFFTELERICVNAQVDVLLWDAEFQGFTTNYRPGDWKRIPISGKLSEQDRKTYSWFLEQATLEQVVDVMSLA
jgi:predicted metal-dependent peptidase